MAKSLHAALAESKTPLDKPADLQGRLVDEMGQVVVADVNDAGGDQAVADVNAAGGTAAFVHTTIMEEESVANSVRFAIEVLERHLEGRLMTARVLR